MTRWCGIWRIDTWRDVTWRDVTHWCGTWRSNMRRDSLIWDMTHWYNSINKWDHWWDVVSLMDLTHWCGGTWRIDMRMSHVPNHRCGLYCIVQHDLCRCRARVTHSHTEFVTDSYEFVTIVMQLIDPHFPDRQWLHYHPLVCVRVCVCVCVCMSVLIVGLGWMAFCVNRGFGVDGNESCQIGNIES